MPLHIIGPVLELLSVVGDELLLIKAVFSAKERERLRALGRGQLAAAIILGIAAWVLLLLVLGYLVVVVLPAGQARPNQHLTTRSSGPINRFAIDVAAQLQRQALSTMRALALLVTILVAPFLIIIGSRFSPEKIHLFVCLLVSMGFFRPALGYVVRHYKENPAMFAAAKLNAANVIFQALGLCFAVFLALCFGLGMSFTALAGRSHVEPGTVISSSSSRGCIKTAVTTEALGRVTFCSRALYGIGSPIAVKVRSSVLGHYVE